MSDQEQYQHDATRIVLACQQLAENFDSVQIFCTRHTGSGMTDHWEFGVGNNYAIYGHVSMWCQTCEGIFESAGNNIDVDDDDREEY